MSRHEGVSCDNCTKNHIRGLRFKCLICFNFDLCQDCQLSGDLYTIHGKIECRLSRETSCLCCWAEPNNHFKDHPMQCVLTKNDSDLYFGGELDGRQEAFTCPYCGRLGLTEEQLEDHVNRDHATDDLDRDVQCPICAVSGTETGAREDFLGHLTMGHRNGPLSGLLPVTQRLRRAGAGRGRRGDSLVDLLASLGASATPARVPVRSTVHHPQPQAAQLLPTDRPSTSRHTDQSSHHNSRLLLTKKTRPSESDLCQTEQARSEKSLFVRQLVLSLLSQEDREMGPAADGDRLRGLLAEPLHEEGAGDEGRQDGGKSSPGRQNSGGEEASSSS